MSKRTTGIFLSLLSLLLLVAPAASAQTSAMVEGTITVLGEGSASAPAEEATIVITIGADQDIYFFEDDQEAMSATPATESATVDVTGIISAIIAFGVPVNDVVEIQPPFPGEWGSGMGSQPTTILVTILEPNVEYISELLEVVRTSAGDEGLFVNQFGVLYSVADCRVLRQAARVEAVAHARAEAEDQAAALNTSLGEVNASRDAFAMGIGNFQVNSCNTLIPSMPYSITYLAGQFDPTLPAEVTVYVTIEVSFEIP